MKKGDATGKGRSPDGAKIINALEPQGASLHHGSSLFFISDPFCVLDNMQITATLCNATTNGCSGRN